MSTEKDLNEALHPASDKEYALRIMGILEEALEVNNIPDLHGIGAMIALVAHLSIKVGLSYHGYCVVMSDSVEESKRLWEMAGRV